MTMGYSFEELRAAVEQALKALVHTQEPQELFAPIWYTLEGGGKRIRPVLCLAVYEWLTLERPALAPVMPVALAIEVFHNFTLLHDDVMDVSALRRGKPTVWKRWDTNTAILSGDAMNIQAYMLLAKAPSEKLVALLERFNEGSLRVCKGQQRDMEFETSSLVTEAQYLTMITDKTSALIEMSVRMGAVLGGATTELETELMHFAREVGIAFQLQDDFLDVYGNTVEFGKECGDDIVTNKQTYLSVLAQTLATAEQLERYQEYKRLGAMHREEKIRKVMSFYDELLIRERCERAIADHLDAAEGYLRRCEERVGHVSAPIRALFLSLGGRKY
jgi:hypothetical protein